MHLQLSTLVVLTLTLLLGFTDGLRGAPGQPHRTGGSHVPVGDVDSVLALPEGSTPEGVAVDRRGNIFIGNRRTENGLMRSDILWIAPDGTVAVLATLDASGNPEAEGLLGLTADPAGNVYGALASFNPSTHGVWKVARRGAGVARLPGSERVPFPNDLTFDSRGNLYVTDSTGGAVWRLQPGGVAHEWVRHVLLAPADPNHPVLPPVGANGIAFSPPDALYVANTQRGVIVQIAIEPDGTPGPVAVVAESMSLLTIDGIALDVRGDIHGVVPGFALLGTDPLVRVEPRTGTVSPTLTVADAFDVPLSIAFAAGPWDHRTVFVTNGALPLGVPGPGPGLVQAAVGVQGFLGR